MFQHALKAGEPLVARRAVDRKGEVAGAHHRIPITLVIERRSAQQTDKERRGFLCGGAHVLWEHRANRGFLQFGVKILDHAHNVRFSHLGIDCAARGNDLCRIDRWDKHHTLAHLRSRSLRARSISCVASRREIASRLSYCRLPLTSASSTLARFFFRYMRRGTMVSP